MIYINNIHLSYGGQVIFDGLTFTCAKGQRIGLLGRNGTGKSTLLKAIAGFVKLDEGSITIDKYTRVGYMPQEVVMQSEKTVIEEVLTASKAYQALVYEKAELEKQLESSHDDSLVARYTELLEMYTSLDVARAKELAEKIVKGLGFKPDGFNQPVAELSVGWKMRVVLAKLLLEDADFYLFDEPTNHLDLPAKEWFFEFLKQGSFGYLLVTHDRHYLDKACDGILALAQGEAVYFPGNYTQYLAAETERREHLEKAFNRQQKEIAQKKATIERFRAKASKARMAQSMEKQLNKIDLIELEPLQPTISLTFPPAVRSGDVALTIQQVQYSFEGKLLFKNVNGVIKRGEKVALVAPNGTGKTTLFNVLAGTYPLQGGMVTFGHNVSTAVFEQDQLKALDPDKTVFEEVSGSVDVPDSTIRSFLGSFLFSGDTISKKIRVLSGGERNRVAMVKVLLKKANFLLLDEPTNHLDLFAKEVLLQALQQFNGTMLFVSHDHAFLQGLATRIWELTPDGIIDHLGTYESYLDHKRAGEVIPSKESPRSAATSHAQKDQGSRKRITSLEQSIDRQEMRIEELQNSFTELAFGSKEYDTALLALKQAQKKLADLTAEWESLLGS